MVKNMEKNGQIKPLSLAEKLPLPKEKPCDITKTEIRTSFRKKRDSLTDVQALEWSKSVNKNLMDWETFQRAESICFYYPVGKEVNLLASARAALSLGKQVYFPKTAGLRMEFYQVSNLSDFKEGNFHVMEPFFSGRQPEGLSHFREEGKLSVDCQTSGLLSASCQTLRLLFLVPGVAFDRGRQRMGYGKGYYDRYLAGFPESIKAGIAYECQIAEHIPTDEGDIPMNYMVTEAEIW